tara:strand:+ start:1205 stop:1981 length:777 start_codon:yes stop_codon:yes gene_type:complete
MMNTTSELSMGELYLISPTLFQQEFKDNTVGNIVPVHLHRLDNVAGSHAMRPYMNSQLIPALKGTARVLKLCRGAPLRALGDFCELYAEVAKTLGINPPVGAYDDIILALQPSQIMTMGRRITDQNMKTLWLDTVATLQADRTNNDEYGYLLNVVAYNVMRRWSKGGAANNKTILTERFDIECANILIVPDAVSPQCFQETGEDPLIPVIESWASYMMSDIGDDGMVFIDSLLHPRLSLLKLNDIHVEWIPEQVKKTA